MSPEREPTAAERAFLERLRTQVPDIQDWYHQGPDGSPWMTVSYDFVERSLIAATLRLDFDGSRMAGGWSPASLNWDDGVRAEDAGVDIQGEDGLEAAVESPSQAADVASNWFMQHIARRSTHPSPLRMGRGSATAGLSLGIAAGLVAVLMTEYASTIFTTTLLMICLGIAAAVGVPALNRAFIGFALGLLPFCLMAGLGELFIGGLGS